MKPVRVFDNLEMALFLFKQCSLSLSLNIYIHVLVRPIFAQSLYAPMNAKTNKQGFDALPSLLTVTLTDNITKFEQ